ncbi:MAG: hypothetical protein U9R05_03405 [Chloroflexota bacterium]|nr:hypothetical protein [Chloroflexota bacterium]
MIWLHRIVTGFRLLVKSGGMVAAAGGEGAAMAVGIAPAQLDKLCRFML